MKPRILLNLALAALVAVLILLVWLKPRPTAQTEFKLSTLASASINRIAIEKPGQPAIVLQKNPAGWRLSAPFQARAERSGGRTPAGNPRRHQPPTLPRHRSWPLPARPAPAAPHAQRPGIQLRHAEHADRRGLCRHQWRRPSGRAQLSRPCDENARRFRRPRLFGGGRKAGRLRVCGSEAQPERAMANGRPPRPARTGARTTSTAGWTNGATPPAWLPSPTTARPRRNPSPCASAMASSFPAKSCGANRNWCCCAKTRNCNTISPPGSGNACYSPGK